MIEPISATVNALYRYPVKGLTPEALQSVALDVGATMPFDRAYAIENGSGTFDPAHPAYLPKIHFLMLMKNEQLAALDCRFEDARRTLRILRDGGEVARGDLESEAGRAAIEDFFTGYIPAASVRGRLRVVSAPGHSFSDVAAKCVHIVNLASVRALAAVMGLPVDARRFRANIIIDGVPAWSELDWVGKTLEAGGTRLEVFKRTERCAATNVDPASGARDMKIPSLLSRTLGHSDFGVYARVTHAGKVARGDGLSLT